jgi:hypothetical protein
MVGEVDNKDKNESRRIVISLFLLVVVVGVGVYFLLPSLIEILSVHFFPHFSSGLGFKDSAVLSFFVTLVVIVILVIVSGDGLLGEIQFVFASFFLFFVIFWFLIAWVF